MALERRALSAHGAGLAGELRSQPRRLVSQLLPMIQNGVITMDHLIKRKGGDKPTVSEKGPLFKINKKDLSFLFPEPKIYSLKSD